MRWPWTLRSARLAGALGTWGEAWPAGGDGKEREHAGALCGAQACSGVELARAACGRRFGQDPSEASGAAFGKVLGACLREELLAEAFGRLISRGTVEGPGGTMASLQCGRAGSGSARPALPLGWLVAASGQASARVACLSRLEKRPCRHAAGRALSGMRSARMQTAGFGASRSRPGRWPESPVCDKLKRPLHSHGAAMYSSGKSVNFVRCV